MPLMNPRLQCVPLGDWLNTSERDTPDSRHEVSYDRKDVSSTNRCGVSRVPACEGWALHRFCPSRPSPSYHSCIVELGAEETSHSTAVPRGWRDRRRHANECHSYKESFPVPEEKEEPPCRFVGYHPLHGYVLNLPFHAPHAAAASAALVLY